MGFDPDRDKELGITGGPPAEGRKPKRPPLVLLTIGLVIVAFCLGALFHSFLPGPTVGELLLDHNPCEVQAVGEAGEETELDEWERLVTEGIPKVGARLVEIQRADGYRVIFAERCTADQMENVP